ncbi:hypothetical protein ENSA5_04760 [Enhygromyxa salina]|uniref:Uncharacterized protein n=2 Tax=Enhygromyxa salina TaxID=215803 RepID=A0A2S9YIP4_9BACT|nr:hypothetical protein ENSA5_04760 [Enhygromyxa salina]
MTDGVITRASFETGCPQEEIDAKFIDPLTIGVTACGHKLIFVVLPNAAGVDCGQPEAWSVNVVDAFPKFCNAVLNSAGAPQERPAEDG